MVLKKIITLTLVYCKFQGKTKEREIRSIYEGCNGESWNTLEDDGYCRNHVEKKSTTDVYGRQFLQTWEGVNTLRTDTIDC